MISIIIPAYNTAKYLPECLDSILSQNNQNFEILLIDDGSTDNTLAICKEYKKNNPKIAVYHTENLGVSNARNLGIQKAKGNRVWFVDSDDVLMQNALNVIEKEFINSDLLVFGVEEFGKSNKTQKAFNNATIGVEETISRMISETDMRGYLFNKVFDLDIIKKNNLHFDNNIKVCEDLMFCVEYMQFASKTRIISNVLYRYRQRIGGAIRSKINENQATAIEAFGRIIELCDTKKNKTKAEALFTKAFYKYAPLLSPKDKQSYFIRVEQYAVDKKWFSRRDRLLINGYRFAHPVMTLLHKKQISGKDLYE